MQRLLAIVPLLFACCALPAQRSSAMVVAAPPPNACFLHYTTDHGLSNDHITAIAKDKLGFLWVGTVNGLNRFDGRAFKVFRHDPHFPDNSLPDDYVLAIAPAPDGWLWIATNDGLCRLDPVRLYIERIALFDGTGAVQAGAVGKIAFDSKGVAWTTSDSGLHKIDPSTGKQMFFLKTEQKTLGWYTMLIDEQDRLWMVKEAVRRYDPATQTLKLFNGSDLKKPFVEATAFTLVKDFSGKIWAGTWSGGIWEYRPEPDEFVRCPTPTSIATMLLPDTAASGTPFLWVGGGNSGLGIFYPETRQFTAFKPDPRDPFTHNNYIATALFRDASNGDVWIGTEVGLEHFAPVTVRFGRAMIPLEKDMNQFSLVSAVVRDHGDARGSRYFVGVWGTGLFVWEKTSGTFNRIRPATSRLTLTGIFNLFQDSEGHLWNCLNKGLRRYNPRTGVWRDYDKMFQHRERSNVFLCGLEDRRGNLWFASNKEGLFRYNPRTDRVEQAFWKKELTDERGNLNITGLSEDAQGRLWLACNRGGLVRFDPAAGTWERFSHAKQDISVSCGAVKVARSGRIYVSYYDAFFELDSEGKLLRYFTQQNKLKTNSLLFIVEDLQGKIWVSSEYLLHCFDPASGNFSYYGKVDGLFSNAMTDGLSITPDGEIFVGFQNAFNFFYPESLRRNLQAPPVAITSIKVMNKEWDMGSLCCATYPMFGIFSLKNTPKLDTFLNINPGEDFFEIEFAALNFNQQARNRYAYLLEGFNKDWVFAEHPVATFTNLDGGTYILRMKAANNDGIWNEEGATLKIRVNPPFYRTWWFVVLLMLAIVGAAIGVLWLRRQQRRRLELFKESLARDLHDEMGSTLSSIRFFSEFAYQQIGEEKPRVAPILHRISQSASALSESMHDIIWAMKTKNDQPEDLAAHMMEFGLRLLEARKVGFKTHIGADFSGKHLRPEVRRGIYLIFKEAVNNAAKYAEATEVELHLALKKGLLLMKISDNGKGFDATAPTAVSGGNGLQNMRRRAAEIGGSIDVLSRPGAGTSVELSVKI